MYFKVFIRFFGVLVNLLILFSLLAVASSLMHICGRLDVNMFKLKILSVSDVSFFFILCSGAHLGISRIYTIALIIC